MRTLPLALLAVPLLVSAPAAQDAQLERVVSGLDLPLQVTAPEGDDRLFVVEKEGLIRIVRRRTTLATPFLDLTGQVTTVSEMGLLGLTFHPNYASNGFAYVHYVDLAETSVIARFTVMANDPNQLDPASEQVVMTLAQPDQNHNAGWLDFGPDGYLYIAFGDGGGGNDPGCRAQNPGVRFGKILRVDVDGGTPFAIPPDNPFVGNPNFLPEIWHLGLRNPWRASFDRQTGDLFIGDVGQDAREEIDFAAAGAGGLNYGWKVLEGTQCNSTAGCNGEVPDCTFNGYEPPIFELTHTGTFGSPGSITGGFVYRGCAIPALQGHYVFADYIDDKIRSFTYDPGTGIANFTDRTSELTPSTGQVRNIASFGEDGFGELYLLSHQTSGSLFKIVPFGGTNAITAKRLGANDECLRGVSNAVLGNLWRGRVLLSNHPGATFAGILGHAAPASGIFLKGGEVLIDLGSTKVFSTVAPASGTAVEFEGPVPCDPSLMGVQAFAQGFILGGAGYELCNALDLTLGWW